MDNWYSKVAKTGLLGTKAKVSADSGKADWSSHDDPTEQARKKMINATLQRIKDPQKG